MASLARWCFRHRLVVLVTWLVAMAVTGVAAHAEGSRYATTFGLGSTDSSRALAILRSDFAARSGDVEEIVVRARHGHLEAAPAAGAVAALDAAVAHLPHVVSVAAPGLGGRVSPDGTTGLAEVYMDAQPQTLPRSAAAALVEAVKAANGPALEAAVGGRAVEEAAQNRQPASMALGVVLALIVLYFAFRRSLLCALLPILSALAAIGVGTSLIGLLGHVIAIPEFGPVLATLVSLGVGVDYALFIVNRHRNGLLSGAPVEDAAVTAINTSGRAVFFAGVTVCIALLGMFVLQVSFLYGVALSAALVVALTMVASLTLLPAMLGFFGLRALRRAERTALTPGPPADGFWSRWAGRIRRHPAAGALVALGIIAIAALPVAAMRQGLADAGTDPAGTTTRQAYDLLARGFGPGYNAPLQVVATIDGPEAEARFATFSRGLSSMEGVGAVTAARPSPDGRASLAVVYPSTAPQAQATADLVSRIRTAARPLGDVHVGGATASQEDFISVLSSKMPQFVAVVVVLAFILLTVVFRSLVVPVVASVMNLLSIGAALGVITAVFQWGWGRDLVGFTRTAPVQVFVPVMLFAVLFGLSMDYEVFLVSRMHEEWVHSGDNDTAVGRGLAETGRVITAAATIMILVFASFVLGGQLVIKEFGLGFAAAIFLDAFVIRSVLVPAVMYRLGSRNWWIPARLDRILPVVHVEPEEPPSPPEVQPATVGR